MRWCPAWPRAPARRKDAWAHRPPGAPACAGRGAGRPASRTWCCCRRSACRSRCWPSSTPSWRSRRRWSSPGLRYSIVRPTAFFKSLSGQVERVQAGQALPGVRRRHAHRLQADQRRRPGATTSPTAWTTRSATTACCRSAARARPSRRGSRASSCSRCSAGRRASGRCRWRCSTPSSRCSAAGGRLLPALAAKAELARIGRYYATESMLVLDPATGRYDADATPSTGTRDAVRLLCRAGERRGAAPSAATTRCSESPGPTCGLGACGWRRVVAQRRSRISRPPPAR